MFTNRDEVLEKALRIFAKMNYEKASQMEIAKTCGLSKAGLVYYFPFKLDLFKAVVDKYVFDTQHSKNKFNFTANSLSEFIDQYVAGVENMMQRLVHLLDDGNNPSGCSFNFYYYHLLMQVRLYYPNVEKKLAVIFEQNYQLWKSAIQKAKENGEIRQDLDVEETASMFWQMFFGTSFEESFFQGKETIYSHKRDFNQIKPIIRFVFLFLCVYLRLYNIAVSYMDNVQKQKENIAYSTKKKERTAFPYIRFSPHLH